MPLPERPAGGVTSVLSDAELLVWLHGEVDLGLAAALRQLSDQIAAHRGPVVVDAAGLTFCDATLAGFLAEASGHGPVSVRAPSRLVREFLTLYGLGRSVSLTESVGR